MPPQMASSMTGVQAAVVWVAVSWEECVCWAPWGALML